MSRAPKPVDWKRLAFSLAAKIKEVTDCERCALNLQQKIHLESVIISKFDRAVIRDRAFNKAAKANPILRWPKYKQDVAKQIENGYRAHCRAAKKASKP